MVLPRCHSVLLWKIVIFIILSLLYFFFFSLLCILFFPITGVYILGFKEVKSAFFRTFKIQSDVLIGYNKWYCSLVNVPHRYGGAMIFHLEQVWLTRQCCHTNSSFSNMCWCKTLIKNSGIVVQEWKKYCGRCGLHIEDLNKSHLRNNE